MIRPEIHVRPGLPYGVTWLFDAPWAHPAWSQYAVCLYDLTTPTDVPPTIHFTGATHEMLLCALDPRHPVDVTLPASEQKVVPLQPPNMGYQFRAADDRAARHRVQDVLDLVEDKRLSPDTDFRATWDALFADGHRLVRSAFEGLAA